MVIWYMNTLWKDSPILLISTCITSCISFLCVKFVSSTLLANFNYISECYQYSHHILHKVIRSYLSYRWKFGSFYLLLPISPPYRPCNSCSTLFLWVCLKKKKKFYILAIPCSICLSLFDYLSLSLQGPSVCCKCRISFFLMSE